MNPTAVAPFVFSGMSMKTKIRIAITTATGAMTVYSLLRKAFAPCLTAVAISTILGVSLDPAS